MTNHHFGNKKSEQRIKQCIYRCCLLPCVSLDLKQGKNWCQKTKILNKMWLLRLYLTWNGKKKVAGKDNKTNMLFCEEKESKNTTLTRIHRKLRQRNMIIWNVNEQHLMEMMIRLFFFFSFPHLIRPTSHIAFVWFSLDIVMSIKGICFVC